MIRNEEMGVSIYHTVMRLRTLSRKISSTSNPADITLYTHPLSSKLPVALVQ